MPEWVHVWFWLRFTRRVTITFPQQERPPGDPKMMTLRQYEDFRIEWRAAGAPQANPLLFADPLLEPVPF